MGRYYRLSKKITDDMATAILNEINELENVQTARITEDYFVHAAYTEQLVFLIICEVLF